MSFVEYSHVPKHMENSVFPSFPILEAPDEMQRVVAIESMCLENVCVWTCIVCGYD